jgi:hypothetical protein
MTWVTDFNPSRTAKAIETNVYLDSTVEKNHHCAL